MGSSQSLQSVKALDTVATYPEFSDKLSETLCFFFNLAWISRFRLPAYLTILFLAADVRLSVEIRIDENVGPDLDEADIDELVLDNY